MGIKEGNKLIDIWIASQENGKLNVMPDEWYEKRCKYHSSWDWLIPVMEKIELLTGKNTEITFWEGEQRCIILDYDDVSDLEVRGETKIEATYKCVIEFIKWYNKQNK